MQQWESSQYLRSRIWAASQSSVPAAHPVAFVSHVANALVRSCNRISFQMVNRSVNSSMHAECPTHFGPTMTSSRMPGPTQAKHAGIAQICSQLRGCATSAGCASQVCGGCAMALSQLRSAVLSKLRLPVGISSCAQQTVGGTACLTLLRGFAEGTYLDKNQVGRPRPRLSL
jgi:hypothetical protein